MKFSVPQNIHSIISILNNGGFNAHLVGGCVRDMILGRKPKDWDITTNGKPPEVKALFERSYDTGLKHGTITVSYNDALVEVTTWRTETGYSDHRRPDLVVFTESLTEDLARRDFTMNAMAYHPTEGLVDPFNGLDDIRSRLIRCVGDPYKRYSEDALRMMRAIRFSAQLDFNIEETSFIAIKDLSKDIAYVSMERIQGEISSILASNTPQKLSLLWDTGLSGHIFPGLLDISSVWLKACAALVGHENAKMLFLALLFLESFEQAPQDHALSALRRLKYDTETLSGVSHLISSIRSFGTLSTRNLRRLATEYGKNIADMTIQLLHALKRVERTDYKLEEFNIKPAISGLDLHKAGLCEGRDIGILLSALNLCLYERPELNQFEILLEIAQNMHQKLG